MKNLLILILLFSVNSFAQRAVDSAAIVHGAVVVFYDFDGQTVVSSYWNSGNPILAAASYLNSSTDSKDSVLNYAKEAYYPFNVIVTRDSTLYFLAPVGRRTRIVFTSTCAWHGCGAGGVTAYSGSISEDVPSFVFDNAGATRTLSLLGIHESGHQLGLDHYTSGNSGSGENSIAPCMLSTSNLYNRNIVSWWVGTNEFSALQNDVTILKAVAGQKLNDVGTTFNHSKFLPQGHSSTAAITINDSDYYKISIPASTINISVEPWNRGSSAISSTFADATLDAAIDLYDENKNFIASSSNTTTVNATLSQALSAGIYFIKVRADRNNPNNSGGVFMGHYTIVYN